MFSVGLWIVGFLGKTKLRRRGELSVSSALGGQADRYCYDGRSMIYYYDSLSFLLP